MKTTLIRNPKANTPVFLPFDFTITVETIEEARLLYHVFNRADLKQILQNPPCPGYSFKSYHSGIASQFYSGYGQLKKEIEQQNFEV